MKALDDAEKASDYLLSEDEFVMDLKKFKADRRYSDAYKEQVFSISNGKWAVFPNDGEKKPAIMGLSALTSGDDEIIGHQFVELDAAVKTVKAVSSLQALSYLRTSDSDNKRIQDRSHVDKQQAKGLIERGSRSYSDEEETGALVGQEMDVLRILYSLSYSEDEINLVRDGFKTKDVFFKRQIDTIKRQLMLKSNRGENFQDETRAILAKAKEIADKKRESIVARPDSAFVVMAYIDWKMNA
jgi:hypothetical protein